MTCSAKLQRMPVCRACQCPDQQYTKDENSKYLPKDCSLKQVKIIALPTGFNWAHIHQFLPRVSWGLEKHAKIKGGSFLFFKLAGLVLGKKKKQNRISIPALMDSKMIERWVRAEEGERQAKKKKTYFWELARNRSCWPTVALGWHLLYVSFECACINDLRTSAIASKGKLQNELEETFFWVPSPCAQQGKSW